MRGIDWSYVEAICIICFSHIDAIKYDLVVMLLIRSHMEWVERQFRCSHINLIVFGKCLNTLRPLNDSLSSNFSFVPTVAETVSFYMCTCTHTHSIENYYEAAPIFLCELFGCWWWRRRWRGAQTENGLRVALERTVHMTVQHRHEKQMSCRFV